VVKTRFTIKTLMTQSRLFDVDLVYTKLTATDEGLWVLFGVLFKLFVVVGSILRERDSFCGF